MGRLASMLWHCPIWLNTAVWWLIGVKAVQLQNAKTGEVLGYDWRSIWAGDADTEELIDEQ